MNFAIVRYLIGWMLGIESIFLLLPALTAVIYGEAELPATFSEQIEKENIEVSSFSLLTVDSVP